MSRALALVLSVTFGLAPVVAPSVALAAGKAAKKVDAKKEKEDPKKKKGEEKKLEPRPGEASASTKTLENLIKKTEVEEDRPMAPARLDAPTGKAVTRDALADQRRDEAIDQIKKILPKQKQAEIRADLFFQLAELWWEKSRYVNIAEEMPALEAEQQKWHKCQQEKGEDACGKEPRVNNRKSELYRKNAVELYAQVIKEYPQYSRVDEIRFILAYNKYDLATSGGEDKCKGKSALEAIEQYRALIALHPKSPFVSDSYTQLGNFYFDCNNLNGARKAFDECIKLKSPKTETYCTYKLAWCDINSGDHESAKKRLKDVISRSDATGAKDDKIKLKEEAMNDIIIPFRELDEVDSAIRYFQEKAGAQGSRKFIKKLADAYFAAGGAKYDIAIKMFKWMIENYKFDPNAPEWQSKIVLAFDKKGLNFRSKVLDEMRVLVNNYKRGSAWWTANAGGDKSKPTGPQEIALNLTEEALYNLVTDYHQEAIKRKDIPTYQLARDIYREYIENFDDSERAYQMRFYYSEVLFALEEFQKAYEQYVKVALNKEREDYKRQSATNSLIAAENLVKIDEKTFKSSLGGAKIEEKKDKGQIEQKQIVKIDKNAKPEELSEHEAQLVTAVDQYLEFIPSAEDEAKVRLRAAVIYFDHVQYVEAARRFDYIINKWPEDPSSAKAAVLVLESLEVKEEWESLNKLSRGFNGNKKLLAGTQKEKEELKKKLPVYIEGSQFKIASITNDEKKDYPLAAKQFNEFVTEFPGSKFAPIGLYNAFVIYQRARQLDTAITAGEKLLSDYKDVDKDNWRELPGAEGGEKRPLILPLLVFDLAKIYEQTADFATAGRYYEKFATDYPADDRAPDAQFNAALWYQAMGENDKAIAAFEKYIKVYQERNKKPEEVARLKLVGESAVFYTIALILEGNAQQTRDPKDWKKAYDKFEEYRNKYKAEDKWKLLGARYKQMLFTKEMSKNPADALKICTEDILGKLQKDLAEADKAKESTKLALAHCKFMQLEGEYEAYTKLRFESPRTLAADLTKKKVAKGKLEQEYADIVKIGNGDWAIAALVRFAMLPKLFAKSLLEAPMPKGLDFDQEELYRATLEEKALEFEEPAITALETAIAKSFELQIYNEWTLEAQKLMAEFPSMADKYAEVRELPLRGSEFLFTADTKPREKAGEKPDEAVGGGSDAK